MFDRHSLKSAHGFAFQILGKAFSETGNRETTIPKIDEPAEGSKDIVCAKVSIKRRNNIV